MNTDASRAVRGLGAVALAWTLAGCGGAFACEDDASCKDGARLGWCEIDGGCSFPDDECPSGRRYGDLSASAGMCVPVAVDTETTSTTAATSTISDATTATATTVGLDTGPGGESTDATLPLDGSSGAPAESSGDPSGSSSSSSSLSSSSSSSGSVDPTDVEPTDAYGMCHDDRDCLGGAHCEPLDALLQTCAAACETDADCPPPPGGSSAPACIGNNGETWCALPCEADGDCPVGMDCSDWGEPQYGLLCTWF